MINIPPALLKLKKGRLSQKKRRTRNTTPNIRAFVKDFYAKYGELMTKLSKE